MIEVKGFSNPKKLETDLKNEIPKPLAIGLVAIIALVAIGFVLFKINPPPARSPQEIGGGAEVKAGQGGLAPIGADGKPTEEPEPK